ncbi:hypothetical protein PENSPDRAFT_669334 [Peniophora sp. CONT]|nr:hypothetical protein PENSPDRAFT_669334 [Peniophora sp. CONT]
MVQLFRTFLSLGLLATASAYKSWSVTVGNETGAALFNPISLSGVASGDVVTFTFSPKNHSVTQSSFAEPCRPLPGGFDTGFANPVSIGAPLTNRPTFNFTMSGNGPVWVYCRQAQFTNTSHCGQDMVFAINPDEPNTGANRTLDTFRKNALVEAFSDLLFGNITTSTATTASATASATAQCSAPYANSLAAAALTNGDDTSDALLNKLNDLAPIVFGLLGGILVIMLAILGVGIAMCVKGRGRIDPRYTPIHRQDRVEFREVEPFTDAPFKYSTA